MATGTRDTYTDSNLKKTIVSDALEMIDWTEAPLLKLLGTSNESKFGISQMGTKIEWIEDTMSPRSGLTAEDMTTTETDLDLATGQGSYLHKGDIIRIGTELMQIVSVSTDTATVIRAVNGDRTTGSASTTGATWTLVSNAAIEGADTVTGHTTNVSRPYNYSQILSEGVKVTETELVDPKWAGEINTMTRNLSKLMGEGGKAGKLPIELEGTFTSNARYVGTSSASRLMGGFDTFVTTNTTALANAALTQKNIEDSIVQCFEAGGSPDTIIVPQWAKRKISSFYKASVRTERSETRGGSYITTVDTDLVQDIEVMYWRWCPSDTLYIIEKQYMGWVTLRPFAIYDRASVGDYQLKDVLGEYSFVVRNEKAHAKISGFSTTA